MYLCALLSAVVARKTTRKVKVFDSKTINVTDGDPARGTAAHNIKWENLVPLKGGKGYGFIVGSTDGNTTMWVASIENNEVNTDVATGTKVIQEPDRGILLSSPNGQTWATYIRNTNELSAGQYFLYYDSTASAELIESIDQSTGNGTIKLSAEGAAMFPSEGDLLIDGEYMQYTMINTEEQTNAAGEKYIEISVTRGGDTYKGRTNTSAPHSKGSQVLMVNDGFLHQDSPTPCLSGIWRFPEYSWSVGEPWYTYIPFVDALNNTRGTYFNDVRPRFDEDMPANYTSDYISFRVEMRDKSGAVTVPTLDRVPMCGRVMVTVGKEAY